MRIMFLIIFFGLTALVGFTLYSIRTVTHDPAVWHVDPLQVEPSPTPNDFRVAPSEFTPHVVNIEAPVYEADAITLARAFDTFVMAQPRVERVAGTVEEGWLTYVQRTQMLQAPDYISVRFYDLDPVVPEAEPAPEPETVAPSQVVIEGLDTPAQPADTPPPAPVETAPAQPLATIAIYSRSRFGYGDMGVNEERVRSWLKALESFEKN